MTYVEDRFQERIEQCQDLLAENDANAVVLPISSNLYYMTGFTDEPMERHLPCFVPQGKDLVFLVSEMYRNQIKSASRMEDIRSWTDETGPDALLEDTIDELELHNSKILIDDSMQGRFVLDLQKRINNVSDPSRARSKLFRLFLCERIRKSYVKLSRPQC